MRRLHGSPLFPYTTLFRSNQPESSACTDFGCVSRMPMRIATRSVFDSTQIPGEIDRKSTRLNSSHLGSSYAVFCLEKKHVPVGHRLRRPRHAGEEHAGLHA